MKTIDMIIIIIQWILLVLSFFINSIVGWYQEKLHTVWFGIFIVFTLLNVITLIGSIISYFYNSLTFIINNQITKIMNYPIKIGLDVFDLIIIILSCIIIYKNRNVSKQFYRLFNLVNTLHFILSILLNGISLKLIK